MSGRSNVLNTAMIYVNGVWDINYITSKIKVKDKLHVFVSEVNSEQTINFYHLSEEQRGAWI